MKSINLIYIGNLFRTRKGLEIIKRFINLLSKKDNFKLIIYQKSLSKKAFWARLVTFCIKSVALLKIRSCNNIKIKNCGSDNAYLSQIRTYDIGISLGDTELDAKHKTRISEYTNQKLNILKSIEQLQNKNCHIENKNKSLEIIIKNRYSIKDFESPHSFENILLYMNGKDLFDDKKNSSIKINCLFTDKFEILFDDQKINELYDVKYGFELVSAKSSNTSIVNLHKNINENVKYVLNKIKLYKNVIYCINIKHNKNVSVRVYEHQDYQNPIFRNTLTTNGLEHIYFKVSQTLDYELEVLTWGKANVPYSISNYINVNNLCDENVYVINLDEQQEKYNQTEMLLNKNGIYCKRFGAKNGKDKKYDKLWNTYEKKELTILEKELGRKLLLSRGALGYLLSMETLFEKAIKNKYEYICIIDDDIIINKKYDLKRLSELLIKLSNFNILKMGSSQWMWENISMKKDYYNSNKLSNGSFFNIYHKNTFKEIYNSIKKYNAPFDGFPLHAFIDKKSYVLYPNYSGAYLDNISTISNKMRSQDYVRFKWNRRDYESKNNSIKLMYKDIKKNNEKKVHFLIGITTFKRYKYLEDCINSLIETLNRQYHFTIILSIGYDEILNNTFYQDLFLKLKANKNLNVIFYSNKLHYIYYNSNIILKYAEDKDFDFGFIINDDILFEKNWFLDYYNISKKTNYDHLCYCLNNSNTEYFDDLKTNGHVLKSNGVLLTFTKQIIEKIGFFDETNFKVRGQSHHDWSFRCCKLRFNNDKTFYDIKNSNELIKLNNKDYVSTGLSYKRLDKVINLVDTYEFHKREKIIKEKSRRRYINSIIKLETSNRVKNWELVSNIRYPNLVYINPKELTTILKLPAFDDFRQSDGFWRKRLFSMDAEPLILDGEWDQIIDVSFEETNIFKAMNDHFINGVEWSQTKFYERVVDEINDGRKKWDCETPMQFLNRLEGKITILYNDIKTNGFKTQKELGFSKISDEVRVAIDRNGEVIFVDGRHRLAIAKILKLEKIPVKVILRHAKWVEFQKTVFQYAENDSKGKIYQLIEHPDLDFVPAHHKDNRFDFLENSIADYDCQNKNLIDIGTHWGHMSHKFEDLGFKCTAIEKLESNVHYLRHIRNACGKNFDIWQGDVFDYPDIEEMDVILALNIFHHFCKTEALHNKFIKLLNRMNAEIMLFQAHRHDPPGQMKDAFRNYNENEFIEFISKHTGLNKWEKLGAAADARPIYKLWKS